MVKHFCISLGLLAAASLPLQAGQTPDAAAAPREISIGIRADQLQREVPKRFLGLAIEKEQLNSGEFARANSSLSRLLENLGEGTLRVGGESADYTAFAPVKADLPPGCRIKRTLAPAAIEEMFHFVQQVRWQVIYALNLGCYSPGPMAQEAQYVYSVSHGSLLAFEVGNEPDMFPLQGYRAASYDSSSFLEQYEAYRAALRRAIPEAGLSGPGVGYYQNGVTWLPRFLAAESQGLAFTSAHFYPMVRPDGLPKGVPPIPESSPVFPTIAHMLNPRVPQLVMENAFVPQMRASEAQKLPFRITEINSAAHGGKTGVSDVFASALWLLDYSFRFLALGADGIDVTTDLPHGAVYSAIQVENGVHVARPIYYGMLVFHEAAQGRTVPVELAGETSDLNFSAYSTAGPDRAARVTLINKDPTLTVRARIRIAGDRYGSAKVLRLSAPSLEAQSGIEFGGAAVRPDGSWQLKSGEAIQEDSGAFAVSVPPGSAALLIAEPRAPTHR
ncbi:MAG: glycosyl hydrolase family protein [Bryobacteraceae bacterium]|jgi:hypothetical protein